VSNDNVIHLIQPGIFDDHPEGVFIFRVAS
jgi:hypothetical protein